MGWRWEIRTTRTGGYVLYSANLRETAQTGYIAIAVMGFRRCDRKSGLWEVGGLDGKAAALFGISRTKGTPGPASGFAAAGPSLLEPRGKKFLAKACLQLCAAPQGTFYARDIAGLMMADGLLDLLLPDSYYGGLDPYSLSLPYFDAAKNGTAELSFQRKERYLPG